MSQSVKEVARDLLMIYAALFLHSFLGGWLPAEVIRPELDLLALGGIALRGRPFLAVVLGFWNGLLRDSLTEGPPGAWTLSLILFALTLSLRSRRKRLGIAKKSLLLSTAILAAETLVFLFREKGLGEKGLALNLFLKTLLPTAGLTGFVFMIGGYAFQRWLFDSGSMQRNR